MVLLSLQDKWCFEMSSTTDLVHFDFFKTKCKPLPLRFNNLVLNFPFDSVIVVGIALSVVYRLLKGRKLLVAFFFNISSFIKNLTLKIH